MPMECAGAYPAYSPDLAPSDFFLFGYTKEKLTGSQFDSREDLLEAIISILTDIPRDLLLKVFEEWKHRLNWVIANNGEYYH